jgi:hypothetical protein
LKQGDSRLCVSGIHADSAEGTTKLKGNSSGACARNALQFLFLRGARLPCIKGMDTTTVPCIGPRKENSDQWSSMYLAATWVINVGSGFHEPLKTIYSKETRTEWDGVESSIHCLHRGDLQDLHRCLSLAIESACMHPSLSHFSILGLCEWNGSTSTHGHSWSPTLGTRGKKRDISTE